MQIASQVRILLVDDHPLVRDGLKTRIASQADWTVCGEADSVSDALRAVDETLPHVVIVDLSLREGNGLDLIKRLATMPLPPKSLVCSMHDEYLYAHRAIHAGANGYVHKQQASQLLPHAIHRVLTGGTYLSPEIQSRVDTSLMSDGRRVGRSPVEQLTDRELAVFEAIGQGLTVSKMAEMMHLSPKTIETYRERVKRKLGVRKSAELIRYAVKWMSESTV